MNERARPEKIKPPSSKLGSPDEKAQSPKIRIIAIIPIPPPTTVGWLWLERSFGLSTTLLALSTAYDKYPVKKLKRAENIKTKKHEEANILSN